MGDVKIRYYTTRQREGCPKWGYWAPCLARRSKKTGQIEPTLMAKLGFELVDCGEDGPRAWALAESWNKKWDAMHAEFLAGKISDNPRKFERIYPPGSLGEGYFRYRQTNAWNVKAHRTKEDWERGWKHIEPMFGDVDPTTIALEDIDLWYGGDPNDPNVKGLLELLGVRESHRVIKIWRAMWRKVGTINRDDGKRYCDSDKDPSLGIRRSNPKGRNAFWYEGQAVRLVKQAWRMNYKGLSAALAVAWDTMLSPIDVRSLTLSQLTPDPQGPLFTLARSKTGKAAIGTLSRRAERLLAAYIKGLPFTLHPDMPIFHTRGGLPGPKGGRPRPPAPYTKDSIGDDFREVRRAVFPDDTRQIQDFRRSGAIEVVAGKGDPAALAGKMANSIDTNKDLQATYTPHTATLVRIADEARARGRTLMRASSGPAKEPKQ